MTASTPVSDGTLLEPSTPVHSATSTELVDGYLSQIKDRTLLPQNEVVDLLLDIRLNLTGGHP